MKIFFLILVTLALMTGTAGANAPSCLKTVSDQDLLGEVALRMNTQSRPQENALASFSCNFRSLTISLVNADTGNEQREELSLTDPTSCTSLETHLSSRIGNRALTKVALVAGCNFKTLMRVSLNPNGMLKRLQDQSLTDPTTCNSARDRINDSL